MKLSITLKELASVASNGSLTYEQASFYATLYKLLSSCLQQDSNIINNAKKIIDLLVSYGLESELEHSYHNLKSKTPLQVQEEISNNKFVNNLIIFVWFKFCQQKSQSIHLLNFEQSDVDIDENKKEQQTEKRTIWVAPEFDTHNLLDVFSNLVNKSVTLSVSAWSEQNRILGATSNKANSLYDYSVVPYLREIVDQLSVNSATKEVVLMKGVQLGATTGILENFIGYGIEHVSNASMLMVTATEDLAKERMDKFIKPMVLDAKMEHRIISQDFFSRNKKSGATAKQMEWVGGGFLKAIGSNSGSSLRSLPVKFLLLDEVDSYPAKVGKEGDTLGLAVARTHTYGSSKKILYISTPLIQETSQIYKAFLMGDQRKYYVPCLKCNEYQELLFNKADEETGLVYGLIFKTLENGNLDYDSVRYLCKFCQHEHKNHDKTKMLKLGKWKATAEPQKQGAVSYQISGLYSPASFKSWEDICYDWLQCWDVVTNKPKDLDKLQVFYNNNLGKPFRELREKLQLSVISKHKRNYKKSTLPNAYAEKHAGQKIRLITAAVDVHADNLAVVIVGWAKGRCFLLDYQRIEGDCLKSTDKSWGKLWELMEKKYTDTDAVHKFAVAQIFIDTGYKQYTVAEAAAKAPAAVRKKIQLIKGESSGKAQQINFKYGTKSLANYRQLIIYIDNYKNYIHGKLHYTWEQGDIMPEGHFNTYNSISSSQLKELTNESKQEVVDSLTGKVVGYKWHRAGKNELFDGLVYNYCAIEFMAQMYYNQFKERYTNIDMTFSMSYFWSELFPRIEQQVIDD